MSDERSTAEDSALTCARQEREVDSLVRDNIGWMLALAKRMLCDRGLAEDAVQEALIDAFRRIESFEERSSLKIRMVYFSDLFHFDILYKTAS